MMMFVISIFTAIFLFAAAPVHPAPVSMEDAEKVALTWLDKRGITVHPAAVSRYAPTPDVTPMVDLEGMFHVINNYPSGFAIIAADDVAYPVLAYSPVGRYTGTNMPPQLIAMLRHAVMEVKAAIDEGLLPTSETADKWAELKKAASSPISQRRISRSVSPLLVTTWDQGVFYNAHCPEDPAGPDGRAYAGCAATAMAQIMKFHAHPARGIGSHRYDHPVYGRLSADFQATEYNWDAMPPLLSDYNDEAAQFIFHCGVSIEMNYGPEGSYAYSSDARNAFVKFFGYSADAVFTWRGDYPTADWLAFLKNDLHKGRPVYYQGFGPDSGHAFIIDGYQGSAHFHVDWGFSGSYNGYYYLDNLTPGGHNYNWYQAAILLLSPVAEQAAINDYTGNGLADLALYDRSNGAWYIRDVEGGLVVWNTEWGYDGVVAVPGDYTGNGISDLAVYHEETGAWHICSTDGDIIAYNKISGGPGTIPVPGDYTGNGRADLALYSESTGRWFIMTMDGNLILWGAEWGGPGTIPVPGDYTGNGRADLALYSESAGQWFVMTMDGNLILWGAEWGGPGMTPVPGDYSGNGLADLALYSESTGQWFIMTMDGDLVLWGAEWGGPGMTPVGATSGVHLDLFRAPI